LSSLAMSVPTILMVSRCQVTRFQSPLHKKHRLYSCIEREKGDYAISRPNPGIKILVRCASAIGYHRDHHVRRKGVGGRRAAGEGSGLSGRGESDRESLIVACLIPPRQPPPRPPSGVKRPGSSRQRRIDGRALSDAESFAKTSRSADAGPADADASLIAASLPYISISSCEIRFKSYDTRAETVGD